jgi:trehalose 6-phosphate phosphatase
VTLDDALAELASVPRLLVALDFDGVLAPIVPVPSDARPLPESAAAIRELAALPGTTVVLVSGRGLADLAAVSGFGRPVRAVGSHGFEFSADALSPAEAHHRGGAIPLDDDQRARLEKLHTELRDLVGGEPGVTLEAKPVGVAVHVRNAPPEVGARVMDAVRRGPAAAPGIECTPGKAVLDLAVLRVTKGSAIEALRASTGADAVFFAGDDVTDETAFAVLRPGDVGVKVGEGDTSAPHRVATPADIATTLQTLAAARSAR